MMRGHVSGQKQREEDEGWEEASLTGKELCDPERKRKEKEEK